MQVMHKVVSLGQRGNDASGSSEIWVGVEGLASGSTVLKGHVGALREGLAVKFTAPATTAPVTHSSTR
jgi:hypothetical protein